MSSEAKPLEDQMLDFVHDVETDLTAMVRDLTDRCMALMPIISDDLEKMAHLSFDYATEMRAVQRDMVAKVVHALRAPTRPVPATRRTATRKAAPKVVRAA